MDAKTLKTKLGKKMVHGHVVLKTLRGKPGTKTGGEWISIEPELLSQYIAEAKNKSTKSEKEQFYKNLGLKDYLDSFVKDKL